MKVAISRRRPRRPLRRDPVQPARPRGHGLGAQRPRRHLRLRRRLLRRDAGRLRGRRPADATPRSPSSFARWADIDIYYRGDGRTLRRPRLLGARPQAAAEHPPGSAPRPRRRRSHFQHRGAAARRAGGRLRPGDRRRRRQQRGPRRAPSPTASGRPSIAAARSSCGWGPTSSSRPSPSTSSRPSGASSRSTATRTTTTMQHLHRRDRRGDLAARGPRRQRALELAPGESDERRDRVLPRACSPTCSQGHELIANNSKWLQLPHHPQRALARRQRRPARRRRPHRPLLDRLGHEAGDGGRDRAGLGVQDARRRRSPRRSAAYEEERRPVVDIDPAGGAGEPGVVRGGSPATSARASTSSPSIC